jgi:drug/metabolite transporter (DMT)-like permease
VLVMAWLFLGEPMHWRTAIGGALMIGGALIVAMK